MTERLIAIAYGLASGWFAVEAADHLVAGSIAVSAVGVVFAGASLALALDYWPARPLLRRSS